MFKHVARVAVGFGALLWGAAYAQDNKVDIKPLDGATSLTETHGDWVINCEVVKNIQQCRMSQQQFSPENNNQRLLAIEFLPSKDGALAGTLAMPFGLALAKPVVLAVDDTKMGDPAPFTTCYPVGCVVPLQLDPAATTQLNTGATLTLAATAADTQQPLTFKISLKGFASALAKLGKLSAP
jgi:invasion protein IalB